MSPLAAAIDHHQYPQGVPTAKKSTAATPLLPKIFTADLSLPMSEQPREIPTAAPASTPELPNAPNDTPESSFSSSCPIEVHGDDPHQSWSLRRRCSLPQLQGLDPRSPEEDSQELSSSEEEDAQHPYQPPRQRRRSVVDLAKAKEDLRSRLMSGKPFLRGSDLDNTDDAPIASPSPAALKVSSPRERLKELMSAPVIDWEEIRRVQKDHYGHSGVGRPKKRPGMYGKGSTMRLSLQRLDQSMNSPSPSDAAASYRKRSGLGMRRNASWCFSTAQAGEARAHGGRPRLLPLQNNSWSNGSTSVALGNTSFAKKAARDQSVKETFDAAKKSFLTGGV